MKFSLITLLLITVCFATAVTARLRSCYAFGDPHYRSAFSNVRRTSSSKVGDFVFSRTKAFHVHVRVKQWSKAGATFVSSIAFKFPYCGLKFVIGAKGIKYVRHGHRISAGIATALMNGNGRVSVKHPNKYRDYYTITGKHGERIVVTVGRTSFSQRKKAARVAQGLANHWVAITQSGHFKRSGICGGDLLEQGKGLFKHARRIKSVTYKIKRGQCLLKSVNVAKNHCNNIYKDSFRRAACVFDLCHLLSFAAEKSFKKQLKKFQKRLAEYLRLHRHHQKLAKHYHGKLRIAKKKYIKHSRAVRAHSHHLRAHGAAAKTFKRHAKAHLRAMQHHARYQAANLRAMQINAARKAKHQALAASYLAKRRKLQLDIRALNARVRSHIYRETKAIIQQTRHVNGRWQHSERTRHRVYHAAARKAANHYKKVKNSDNRYKHGEYRHFHATRRNNGAQYHNLVKAAQRLRNAKLRRNRHNLQKAVRAYHTTARRLTAAYRAAVRRLTANYHKNLGNNRNAYNNKHRAIRSDNSVAHRTYAIKVQQIAAQLKKKQAAAAAKWNNAVRTYNARNAHHIGAYRKACTAYQRRNRSYYLNDLRVLRAGQRNARARKLKLAVYGKRMHAQIRKMLHQANVWYRHYANHKRLAAYFAAHARANNHYYHAHNRAKHIHAHHHKHFAHAHKHHAHWARYHAHHTKAHRRGVHAQRKAHAHYTKLARKHSAIAAQHAKNYHSMRKSISRLEHAHRKVGVSKVVRT